MTQQTNIQEAGDDVLKSLDWIIVVDHSGSMGEQSVRMAGKTRFEEVQEDALAIARIASKYDDDGITIVSFATAVNVHDGVTPDTLKTTFNEFPPRGSTNLSGALDAVYTKAKSSSKEVVAIVFTDGVPNDQGDVVKSITKMATTLGRPKIGLALIQVGTDVGAKQFLEYLDDHLASAKVPDVVATVTAEEAEGLSVPQLVWLARNA